MTSVRQNLSNGSVERESEPETVERVVFLSSSGDSMWSNVPDTFQDFDWAEQTGYDEELLNDVSFERVDSSGIERDEDTGELSIQGSNPEEYEDALFIDRPATFFDSGEKQDERNWEDLQRLQKEYGLNFIRDQYQVRLFEDKIAPKKLFNSIEGVKTPETYEVDLSETESVEELLEEEKRFMVKPDRFTNQGDGIERIESVENLENYTPHGELDLKDLVVEEYVDLENFTEKRMFGVEGVRTRPVERGFGNSLNLEENFMPQNINNGASYRGITDRSELTESEKRLQNFVENLPGINAVDYAVKEETGELYVFENNNTPGHKINQELEIDLYEEESKMIADKIGEMKSSPPVGSYDPEADSYQRPASELENGVTI